MSIRFDAEVDGVKFSAQEQSPESTRFAHALSLAHRRDVTYCLCNKAAPQRLVVKLYRGSSANAAVHYGLACWPGTGLEHDPNCDFFPEDIDDTHEGDTKPAFDDLGGGRLRAHLATSLKVVNSSNAGATQRQGGAAKGGDSRSRASEIALLSRLWRKAGLNVFKGEKRAWFNATFALINAAKKIEVNASGDTLADFLMIAAGEGDHLAKKHNAAVLSRAALMPSRLFVIGRVRSFKVDKPQILLPLSDFKLLPKILVRTSLLEAFLSKRLFYQNVLSNNSANVIAISCIEPNGTDWWKTVSVTGIAVTKSMIPVESSYEVQFEQYLTSNGRVFIKPMIVDEISDADNRPDFILLDTNPRVRCEVWGMNTEEYVEKKAKRVARYKELGQTLLSWSGNPPEPFPRLPAKIESAAHLTSQRATG